jgi:hypothetical protein
MMTFSTIGLLKKVFPNVRIKIAVCPYSAEGVVKDAVILWANSTCFWIENKMDGGGMKFANAKVDASSTANGPLRYFLGILKTRIENIDGTAKDVCSNEMVVISEDRTGE